MTWIKKNIRILEMFLFYFLIFYLFNVFLVFFNHISFHLKPHHLWWELNEGHQKHVLKGTLNPPCASTQETSPVCIWRGSPVAPAFPCRNTDLGAVVSERCERRSSCWRLFPTRVKPLATQSHRCCGVTSRCTGTTAQTHFHLSLHTHTHTHKGLIKHLIRSFSGRQTEGKNESSSKVCGAK